MRPKKAAGMAIMVTIGVPKAAGTRSTNHTQYIQRCVTGVDPAMFSKRLNRFNNETDITHFESQ